MPAATFTSGGSPSGADPVAGRDAREAPQVGARVHLKPLRIEIGELGPSDRPALRFIFDHLGPDSRQQRFLHPKLALGARELDELTCLDHWHHDALIARSAHPRVPIGVGRYVRGEEFDLAEVAITVSDRWQRRGVGMRLLLELRERARRAGIRRFGVMTMRTNEGALHLAHELGPCRVMSFSAGVIELECRCA